MTLEELEKFPNALDAFRNYYVKKLEDSMKQTQDIPDDFKQMLKDRGVTDDTIVSVINENPANLFYFFDEYKILINITSYNDGLFNYSILGHLASIGTSTTFPLRKEAEKQAIQVAISELENVLTKSVSYKENS